MQSGGLSKLGLIVKLRSFLGFDINTSKGHIQYVYPSKPWHFRSPKSAGKISTLLSGLISRVHLIARHSFPEELIIPSIKHLIELYITVGFAQGDRYFWYGRACGIANA